MTGEERVGSTEFHYVLLYDLSSRTWHVDDASCYLSGVVWDGADDEWRDPLAEDELAAYRVAMVDLEAAVAMLNDDGDDATA